MPSGWSERLPFWARSPTTAREWWVGTAKAIGRGTLFSPHSRIPIRPAPGGTHEESIRWSPLRRLLFEQSHFSWAHHRVPIPGLSESLRILHLSDVHLREPGAWLNKLCSALSECSPDLLLLTGDMVSVSWNPAAGRRFLEALPEARLGRFHVGGNWELIMGDTPPGWLDMLEELGIESVDNRRIVVGPIQVAGVEDWLAGQADLKQAIDGAEDLPMVLLAHTPLTIEAVTARPEWRNRVSLVLSGHTHGGQIRLPKLGSPWVPKGTGPYVSGWYCVEGIPLFVNRGVGWSLLPVRMWSPPEFAMIELIPGPP